MLMKGGFPWIPILLAILGSGGQQAVDRRVLASLCPD
jgi:hypothetical protein